MKLCDAVQLLREAGIDNPQYDARELFIRIGKMKQFELLSPNAECCSVELCKAIARRQNREPLQYIIGNVEFYRESYTVTPDCLIPRQDTEILVDYAVKNIPRGKSFLDLCTGSGCVAISTLKNTSETTAYAVDISEGALRVARINAEKNCVSDRLELILADATEPIFDKKFYAILANPPYVTLKEYSELEPEIYFEPKIAFVGGDDGLDFYKKIITLYKSSVSEGGFIAFEIGYKQGKALKELALYSKMSCEIIKDYSGNDRVAVLRP